MSTMRRRGLRIDDPLGPGQAEGGPVSEDGRRGEDTSGQPAEIVEQPQPPARGSQPSLEGVWRAWSGITGVGSFRLPHELLVELNDTARELGLPIGLIVTAALTQLLEQPPEHIAELVDRADDARIQGRRNARRRLGRPDGEG